MDAENEKTAMFMKATLNFIIEENKTLLKRLNSLVAEREALIEMCLKLQEDMKSLQKAESTAQ